MNFSIYASLLENGRLETSTDGDVLLGFISNGDPYFTFKITDTTSWGVYLKKGEFQWGLYDTVYPILMLPGGLNTIERVNKVNGGIYAIYANLNTEWRRLLLENTAKIALSETVSHVFPSRLYYKGESLGKPNILNCCNSMYSSNQELASAFKTVTNIVENTLKVQTGLTFQIPKLNFVNLIGNMIYLIGDTNKTRYLPHKLQQLFQKYFHENHINEKASSFRPIGSILDIPQEYRNKSIIICFDEPSYNGRQCLYHLFGGNIPELSQGKGKPYQAFSELIDRVQDENTCGIVFVPKALQNDTLKPVMWCPATVEEPKKVVEPPKFPKADVDAVYHKSDKMVYPPEFPGYPIYPVENLSDSMKTWVKKTHPETAYVNFGNSYSNVFAFWGWNKMPTLPNGTKEFDWYTTFTTLAEPTSPPLTQQADPVAAQLAALTDAITALTKLVSELPRC